MFDNFPLVRNFKMFQKLIFMKIQDGDHMNPMGHEFFFRTREGKSPCLDNSDQSLTLFLTE